MNKKIICISIVSMFLLTGLTTLSSVGMKISDNIGSLNNPTQTLTVYLIADHTLYPIDGDVVATDDDGVEYHLEGDNKGQKYTGELPVDENPNIYTKYIVTATTRAYSVIEESHTIDIGIEEPPFRLLFHVTDNIEDWKVDLVISRVKIEPKYIPSSDGGFWAHRGYIYIKNIGTATLKKSSGTSYIATRLIAKDEGEVVIDTNLEFIDYWKYHASINESLEPGEELCGIADFVDYWDDFKVAPGGSSLTLILNWDYNVPETDHTNNCWHGIAPKIKSHDHNRPLFSLLNRLPIFQRILEKLALF